MNHPGAVAAALLLAVIPGPALALANPASLFCANSGRKTEILRTVSGGEIGICILPGGAIVEEWAYYRAHSRQPASPGR